MAEKKVELLEGTVEKAAVYAERTDREVVRLMKVVSVTRTPQTLISRMSLQTKAGMYALEIDEPTVRAMARVFDDFHAQHPGGKAPPPPPERPIENEGKPPLDEED
jgi:hypothetical protein